jgi:thymidylate synthase (FAD)
MKANLREWRHILELRTSERAHPEMRRLMIPLLFELHDKIPIIFDDIFEKVQHTAVK